MSSMRRPLVVLVLSLALGLTPVVAQAAPLALPRVPSCDLGSVLDSAWSAVQGFMSKLLVAGGDDDPTTSTTQSTPGPGTTTPTSGGSGDNGAGIDPNG